LCVAARAVSDAKHNLLDKAILNQGGTADAAIKFGDLNGDNAKQGSAFAKAGNLECALQHFRADLDAYDDVDALYNYGSILQKLGWYSDSVTYLEQALQKDPNDAQIAKKLAQAKAKAQ
jgi:tetratricopeptide (TPR) repeat protein